jgi:hypothetical protein
MDQTSSIIDLAFKRHADELRATWQVRMIEKCGAVDGAGIFRPHNALGACALSMLAHNFDDAMPVIMRIAFPSFQAVGTPMLCSAAKIAKTGQVMASFITRAGLKMEKQVFFQSTRAMESAFRSLADSAGIDGEDREETFAAVKRWVVCDFRLDPTMSSADPDAKRLTVN